ncbi:MAG: hypothetical protein ACE5FE_06445 [Acidiferrobacterales bacterium]
MRLAARVIALCLLVFLSLATFADTLAGKVIKITDGDTLYVLDANYEQHKITEFVTNATASAGKTGPR